MGGVGARGRQLSSHYEGQPFWNGFSRQLLGESAQYSLSSIGDTASTSPVSHFGCSSWSSACCMQANHGLLNLMYGLHAPSACDTAGAIDKLAASAAAARAGRRSLRIIPALSCTSFGTVLQSCESPCAFPSYVDQGRGSCRAHRNLAMPTPSAMARVPTRPTWREYAVTQALRCIARDGSLGSACLGENCEESGVSLCFKRC